MYFCFSSSIKYNSIILSAKIIDVENWIYLITYENNVIESANAMVNFFDLIVVIDYRKA